MANDEEKQQEEDILLRQWETVIGYWSTENSTVLTWSGIFLLVNSIFFGLLTIAPSDSIMPIWILKYATPALGIGVNVIWWVVVTRFIVYLLHYHDLVMEIQTKIPVLKFQDPQLVRFRWYQKIPTKIILKYIPVLFCIIWVTVLISFIFNEPGKISLVGGLEMSAEAWGIWITLVVLVITLVYIIMTLRWVHEHAEHLRRQIYGEVYDKAQISDVQFYLPAKTQHVVDGFESQQGDTAKDIGKSISIPVAKETELHITWTTTETQTLTRYGIGFMERASASAPQITGSLSPVRIQYQSLPSEEYIDWSGFYHFEYGRPNRLPTNDTSAICIKVKGMQKGVYHLSVEVYVAEAPTGHQTILEVKCE